MKFILLARQRSGTGFLTSLLNSHPDIKCYSDERVEFIPFLKENQGLNLKYDHLHIDEIDLSSFKIIHLLRKDLLRLTISQFINKNKKLVGRPTPHIYSDPSPDKINIILREEGYFGPKAKRYLANAIPQKHKPIPFSIDLDELCLRMQQNINMTLPWYQKYKNRSLHVYYEDLTSNQSVDRLPTEINLSICNFLNVSDYPLSTVMLKVNPYDYSELVLNWSEVLSVGKDLQQRYLDSITS